MNRILLIVFFSHFLVTTALSQAPTYVPHTVVVKLNEKLVAAKGATLLFQQDLAAFSGVEKLISVQNLVRKQQSKGNRSVLDGLYKITLNTLVEEQAFLASLSKYNNVLYAERYPNVYPLEVPNDPQAKTNGPQYHLAQIRAYDAWSSTRGNKEVVIGIIDTGIDLDHEDLVPNLYVNEAELIDGIDNDNDGYIDNAIGWDLADNDNSPEADNDEHGTVIAGVAAAATNNALGIAGVGYNTKLMPIKIFQTENNFSSNSYEGIIYAADQGCDIINLSWGSIAPYSQYAQDIINYAALERNVVIVAAAGNTNAYLDFYPASYENVLSVGFVDRDDRKSVNATYSYFIDLVAPGENIFSTKNGDTYGTDGGSSLAAPMVAGAAALVKAFKPSLSAIEIMQLLRINTDDISTVGTNNEYPNQLGSGRLNIFKALNNDDKPAVRITSFSFNNGFEEAAYYGDTLSISIDFTNYLAAVDGLSISMKVDNPYVTVLESDLSIGSMAEGEQLSNASSPLRLVLANDIPEGTTLYLQFKMEGDFYEDYQAVKLEVNQKNRVFNFGDWDFSLSATGNIGFNKQDPFRLQQLRYNGINLIKHLGVVLSASSDSVAKNIAIAPLFRVYAEDFETVEELKRFEDITADLDIRSEFRELPETVNPLGINVRQRVLGWTDAGHDNYLVLSYELLNKGELNYDSLYFNLFSDWAIGNFDANYASYDASYNMAYATDEINSLYVGLAGLVTTDSVFYPLDLASYNSHMSDLVNDTLSNQLLWDFNLEAFSKLEAGDLAGGNDVASLQGNLLRDYQAGQVREYKFVLATASTLEGLRIAVDSANVKLEAAKTALPLGQQVLLCEGDTPIFTVENEDSIRVFASPVVDTALFAGDSLYFNIIARDSTLYYEVIDAQGFASLRKRLELKVIKPVANFTVQSEPYLLTPGALNTFRFTDLSTSSTTRKWIFSNGYESVNAMPSIPFTEAATVAIQLVAENEIGCTDTLIQSITIALRAQTPAIDNVKACSGATISLSDPAIGALTVYADSLGTNQLFQGVLFVVAEIQQDTVFYVRNENGEHPSILKAVQISILDIKADFELFTDINSNSSELQALAVSNSNSEQIQWLLNGEAVGTTDSIYVSLIGFPEAKLQLVATNDFGCTDTLTYQAMQSEAPLFTPYTLCNDQSVTIEASNTDKLYFYADENLTTFLAKGSFLSLNGVDENASIYAVNVDAIIPSEVVRVPILVSVLTAGFTMNRDTLNLAYKQQVTVVAQDVVADSYTWFLGDGRQLSGKEVSFTYSTPGIYELILSVRDSLNCVESTQQRIIVFDDPILDSKEAFKKFFKVFPNPTNQVLYLEGIDDVAFDQYQIVDIKGKVVLSSENNKPSMRAEVINVALLPEGIYYLVIKKEKTEASFMFMVKR